MKLAKASNNRLSQGKATDNAIAESAAYKDVIMLEENSCSKSFGHSSSSIDENDEIDYKNVTHV